MITGYNYFDYAQKAIRIGVEDYILKPVSKQEISEIITKLVHFHQEKEEKNIATGLSKGDRACSG